MALKDIYGYCVIPKSTLLYRGHEDIEPRDCMFFATTYLDGRSWNEKVQVWRTKVDIEVLFVVEYLNSISNAISALPQLFNDLFPLESNPNFTDLDIKHWDLNRRDKLVQRLYNDYKISGWVTSIENNSTIEVCLFDKRANSNQIEIVEIHTKEEGKYYRDSLVRIKVFPTPEFYSKTKIELMREGGFFDDENESFKKHKRYISAWTKDYVQRGMSLVEAKHKLYDLRLKLKI